MFISAARKRATGGQTIARYVGFAIIFVGVLELAVLIVLPFDRNETIYAPCFIFPGICAMIAGYLVYFQWGRGLDPCQLTRGQASACILIIWLAALGIYALPFMLAGILDVPQAIFEAASGLTTTGLSVIDPDSCPRLFLLHRSLMHYFGGVGLVLVLTSTVSHGSGLMLYNTEGHTDRLLPKTVSSARMILILYSAIIVVGACAYIACGMSVFDAVNMSISAVSTGGFAVHASSIGYYSSASIELVSIVLMLAGATNFLLNFMLVTGQFKAFFSHIETRYFYGTILVATIVCALSLCASGQGVSPLDAIRIALFHVVSVITTTGFQTVPSFSAFPATVLFVFIFLMFIGSEAGSTSGGIKIYRAVLALKSLKWNLQQTYGTRRRVISHKIDRFGKRSAVTPEETRDVATFIIIYIAIFICGSFVFTLCGASISDAAFDFASCLGNAGVSVGFINAGSSPVVLICAALGMIVGRLEVIPVFLGLYAIFSRRKRRMSS